MLVPTIYPAVRYKDTNAAIKWLVSAFGLLPAGPGAACLYLVVEDPDAHYQRAVAAGAEIVQPLEDADYGSRGYTARDPEGNLWSFGTYRPARPGA